MMTVHLEVKKRKNPYIPIEADEIIPKNFINKDQELFVWRGNRKVPLEEVFLKRIEGTASYAKEIEIVITGESGRIKRVGEYMDAGAILIEGDIGMHCGNFMSGGTIEIRGDADAWLGREMTGGTIVCRGNAGDYCGSGYRGEKKGMRGGTVEVFGDAGDFTAEALAGGTIVVHGNAGDLCGAEMKGGALVIHGNASRVCGNMSGGTCTVYGTVADMLPTFAYVGTTEDPDSRTALTEFAGDVANRGKGRLLVHSFIRA
ncbi:MAG: formylmethanofuran dehydrogenase subunit [Methanofollis sp.]|nr:formylmethanofuran dehydrogenase subunit [Methanofollis sp.]